MKQNNDMTTDNILVICDITWVGPSDRETDQIYVIKLLATPYFPTHNESSPRGSSPTE